jgi:hypothetical protein
VDCGAFLLDFLKKAPGPKALSPVLTGTYVRVKKKIKKKNKCPRLTFVGSLV